MKEYPILFSGDMVRALLEERKTRTRRLDKQWMKVKAGDRLWVREAFALEREVDGNSPPFSYGRPIGTTDVEQDGDYYPGPYWVQAHYRATDIPPQLCCTSGNCKIGESEPHVHWKPSIHMPRWASRITLEATEDAGLERLSNMTTNEALLEGIDRPENCMLPPVYIFERLWNSLHDRDGERWEDDPEVVVLAFKVIQNVAR